MDKNTIGLIILGVGVCVWTLQKIHSEISASKQLLSDKILSDREDQKKKLNVELENKISTLNPVFSERQLGQKEREINEQQIEIEKNGWDAQDELGVKELRDFLAANKEIKNFKPSVELSIIFARHVRGIITRDILIKDLREMVQANIRVLNGMSIEQSEKEYYARPGSMIKRQDLESNEDDQLKSRIGVWERELGDSPTNKSQIIVNK